MDQRPRRSNEDREESDVLILDAQTLEDLDIFDSRAGPCLFDLCNRTKTDGGARALRRRMEAPWARADRIRSTQASLSFVLARRRTFDTLPSAYVVTRVSRYTRDVLPSVTQESRLGFIVGAFALWMDDDSRYVRILIGVQLTCRLIEALRQLIAQIEVPPEAGEIAALLTELRELLDRPALARLTLRGTKHRFWTILAIDKVLRRHEKPIVKRIVDLVYEIDALVSMADVTSERRFVLPQVDESAPHARAEGLIHPFLAEPVANPVELDQQRRLLFLTGPNMAGKTTYLRAFATALYLGHLGMGVPARSFRFVPVQRLFSSISLHDDLHSGVSYFRAEALRVKAIAEAITAGQRVVALLDEPFKGTNVKDAVDASQAILVRFARSEGCLFMFSSHLIELRELLDDTSQIDYRYFEADEKDGWLDFDYRLRSGVSSQRLGMRVLREEGIFELLDGTRAVTQT